MMMRMKLTFILAILLFQLTISVKGGGSKSRTAQHGVKQGSMSTTAQQGAKQFDFGDIIKFKRKIGPVSFNHYVIYVDDQDIEGKLPGQDIFHFSGEINNKQYADCVFGKLEEVTEDSTAEKQNYRDYEDEVMNYQDMVNKITTFHKNCQRQYRVVSANCEHLVTVIRYGSATCRQEDTNAFTKCLAKYLCNITSTLFPLKENKRGLDRRGLGLLRDEIHANQGAPAA
ncbi:uncharacterized protein [Salmo salar]|uniref:LRAT domain-containing protein n=1 Tax=Salmo salar TaxID=8030 RepID=A0A1S3PL86_SALSA|nr:uncharacterized protein LOC106586060 [Salmo salar]